MCYSFAQKVSSQPNQISPEANTRLSELLAQWPENIAYSEIWDEDVRKKVTESLPSEHALAKRREQVIQRLPNSRKTSNDTVDRISYLVQSLHSSLTTPVFLYYLSNAAQDKAIDEVNKTLAKPSYWRDGA